MAPMKQNASTAGMIYRIDEQLSSISQFVTLEPGQRNQLRQTGRGRASFE
jgi:hypothetical protein